MWLWCITLGLSWSRCCVQWLSETWPPQGTVAGLLPLLQMAAWWRSEMLLLPPPWLSVGQVPPFSFWKSKWEPGVASTQPSWSPSPARRAGCLVSREPGCVWTGAVICSLFSMGLCSQSWTGGHPGLSCPFNKGGSVTPVAGGLASEGGRWPPRPGPRSQPEGTASPPRTSHGFLPQPLPKSVFSLGGLGGKITPA